MKIDPTELIGPGEICELLNAKGNTVANWRRRGLLPEPIATVKMGPLWTRTQIETWAAERAAKKEEKRLARIEYLEQALERLK